MILQATATPIEHCGGGTAEPSPDGVLRTKPYSGLALVSRIENTGEKREDRGSAKHFGYSVSLAKPRRRRQEQDPKYLTTQEIADLFRVIEDLRDRALFRVIYHRGLRAHEPGRLQLQDFREREGRLHVTRGKGSAGGEYKLCDEELRSLRAYVRYRRGNAPGPLFLSRNHRAISRIQVWRLMQRYCALAGIDRDKAHPHALKHS